MYLLMYIKVENVQYSIKVFSAFKFLNLNDEKDKNLLDLIVIPLFYCEIEYHEPNLGVRFIPTSYPIAHKTEHCTIFN